MIKVQIKRDDISLLKEIYFATPGGHRNMNQLMDTLRDLEKHKDGVGITGGLLFLKDLVKYKFIKPPAAKELKKVIINYDLPYEITCI